MKNLWNQAEAAALGNDLLALRVYSSRLIGQATDLVLHGGGNTSVKGEAEDLFGTSHEALYVKGSGWDLATIESPGFPAVKMEALLALSRFETLSDADMVKAQRAAMLDPSAPSPSVEAILHALIPFRFVDHTHADAVVTLSNTPQGEEKMRALYGDRVLVVPYVMPGFILAKEVARLTEGMDWSRLEGMVLMHHGIFSFADDAKESYSRMIDLVSVAEGALGSSRAKEESPTEIDPIMLAGLRKEVSRAAERPLLVSFDGSSAAAGFASRDDVKKIATQGPLTPDHVIRTKRVPLIVGDDLGFSVDQFVADYQAYFEQHTNGAQTRLDSAPRWAVWPGKGTVAIGVKPTDIEIIGDIVAHTRWAIQQAESHGGWQALPASDIFDVEYWELEQAKLGKGDVTLPFSGRCALVTGGASGIGAACARLLAQQGAEVVILDKEPIGRDAFDSPSVHGMICDLTNKDAVRASVSEAAQRWGGLDILVSNAGIFSASHMVADMPEADWQSSMDINLTGAMHVVRESIPFLRLGWEPSIIFIGSKNVPAPGPAAGAYSVAKAGLAQLARVLAFELAPDNIRVNTVHPNGVFDTAIWTDEVLESRASHYGMSVASYRRNNLLGKEVRSEDVAQMVCAIASKAFRCTTGAQVPIDGGNERVI